MDKNDMFIKVEMTAYFSVNGKNIEKRKFANDEDADGIYLDGKRISPDIDYFYEVIEGDVLDMVKLPPKKKLGLESVSYSEELVSRAEIWRDDRSALWMDKKFEKLMKAEGKPNNAKKALINSSKQKD